MFARVALRSSKAAFVPTTQRLMARRTFMAESPSHQMRDFVKAAPVPVEAYPLIGIVGIMCTFAAYHLTKHIWEDHDHVRWNSKRGLVEYVTPEMPSA